MGVRLFVVILCAASLWGQRRHSWQDACFKNPGLPYCQGRDYAVKKPKPTQAPPIVVTNPGASTPRTPAPSIIVVGGAIDWRFADPLADALIGIHAHALPASLLAQLGAGQGFFGADQIAVSIRDNRLVAFVTGVALSSPEAGLKVAPISGSAMLIGHPDAVDQAVERIGKKAPLGELVRSAEERQSKSELWAIASPRSIGSPTLTTGVKRLDLTLSPLNGGAIDLDLEFDGAPNADTIRAWQTQATIDGSVAHLKMSLDSIVGNPLGQRLATLAHATRYLPVQETPLPKRTKAVIYGLDGGPKEVN